MRLPGWLLNHWSCWQIYIAQASGHLLTSTKDIMPQSSGFRKLLLVVLASSTYALNVPIPLLAASAVPRVSPSLISLSIEMDRWTDWAGTTSRNVFFYNTLDNLKQITGAPPQIRIGANSEDHTNFRQDTEVGSPCYSEIISTLKAIISLHK
jgi:hypothetical protein